MSFGKLKSDAGVHPAVPTLYERFATGHIPRREFLRTLSLLGMTGAALGAGIINPRSGAWAQEQAKQGGALRFAIPVQKIADPSTDGSGEAGYLFRNNLELLTWVDQENIVRPYLAESWKPSEDLKTWEFKLRSGVKWSNGDDLTTKDVAYTINRWLRPVSKSPNKTAFAAITDIDVRGPLDFVIHLNRPVLPIAEMLASFKAVILHHRFDEEGADWSRKPVGTGPYDLIQLDVGEQAVFRRRQSYWGKMPYLEEIRFIDLGEDSAAQIAALAAGQVDMLQSVNVSDLEVIQRLPGVVLQSVHSAQTTSLRMQVDQKPFDDLRVRRAISLAANNQQMLDLAYRGKGTVAENHHVAPSHPDYFKLPALKRDVEQAKHLIREAGHADGLKVEMTVGNTHGRWEQDACQILQQNCAEVGIQIALKVLPASEYWPVWNKVPFGATFWDHRPLGVMLLDSAFRTNAVWNETHYSNPVFERALDQAMTIVDPVKRSAAMEAVEQILQDDAVTVQPFWVEKFTAHADNVQGYKLHPSNLADLTTIWMASA